MDRISELLEKARVLPQDSGCYLMRDKSNRVIYVGKAKRLRSRVTSYFDKSTKSVKTQFLVTHIADFDFIITRSDAESYVLENNLIKEHSPKYNIRLRDDKTYPWVMVDYAEPFPRLSYVRRPKKVGSRSLFGPFPAGSNISLVMRVLTKSFMLRDCSLSEFKARKTPCLLYQMGQCSAPCVSLITPEAYEKDLQLAVGFFQSQSKAKKALNELRRRMQDHADSEAFERAALVRDQLSILENFLAQSYEQHVESLRDELDVDIWSHFLGEEELDLSLYMVRGGMLLGQKNFHFLKADLVEELKEVIRNFHLQYYSDPELPAPALVIVDDNDDDLQDFASALRAIAQGGKKLNVRGRTKKFAPLLEMCHKHAEESQRVRALNAGSVFVGLKKLKELLGMVELPRRLECFDVAVWQGSSPTASQVVSEDGRLDKTSYRHYHLQQLPEGNNDFAMMREVLSRRLSAGALPDVLIVDGGTAQVNIALAVLRELELVLPVVGIAKARDLGERLTRSQEQQQSEERLVIPGRKDPYILSRCPPLMRLIVGLRDEAHRFSRKLHHKAESRRVIHSWVDEVKGLGQTTREQVLKNLTLPEEALASLSPKELASVFGVDLKKAQLIANYFADQLPVDEQET